MERFFKHPWLVVGVVAAITVFFTVQLPKTQMDNNISNFLPQDNPARITTEHLEAQYGDEITIIVGLERSYGTVFDRAFLSRVKEFTDAAEEIELVKNTNSLITSQYLTADSESIIVTDLVNEDFSGTPEEIAELKRRLASWDMYRGSFVSDDLSAAQIAIKINAPSGEAGSPEVVAVLTRLRDMAKEIFAGYAAVYTTGQPVISATINESVFTDVTALIPLVVVVLLGVLILSFRRLSYVTLPLLTVLVSVLWAVGAMPLLGITMTMLSAALPTMLIAVGSAYAIHVISHYKDEVNDKTFTADEHRSFVLGLVRKLLKPVFLAAITTFAGFISFAFAPLAPIRDFGIFASFGVLAAFAVAMTLIPAILLIRGPRAVKLAFQKKIKTKKPRFDFDNELAATLSAVTNKKGLVLVITVLIVVVSVIGASKVVVDNAMVEFFNNKTEVSRSDRFIREYFGGSTNLILSVETDETQTLLSPQTLTAIDGLSAYLIERVPSVTKVTGFTDMIKRMNQLFNVDESPDGIAAGSLADSGDSDFGFGDFGFEEEDGGSGTDAAGADVIDGVLPSAELQAQNPPRTADFGQPPSSSMAAVTFAMLNAAAGERTNMSANELVREIERMTNYEGYSYYEIPANPARYGKTTDEELQQLISNYLVLLGGQTEDSMSNDPLEPTAIQTIILINSQWQRDAQNVINTVNDYVAANFPKNVRVLVGGGEIQEGAVVSLVVKSQIISILISVLIVLVIVAFSYKSLAAGLIAALPLAIAIIGNFAVMGLAHITINVATALIASLAVGIGIDYTIHFIDAFKREYAAGGDYLHRTFSGAGKAILINAVSVGASFGVLALSRFRVMAQFGALIGLSMAISAIVSLTVIPVLLITVKPKFIYGKQKVQPSVHA
ncbi:MAG: MMPL family transporter [Treponema sp.]|jgi:predicted RND superfamily exporter protein|nr:MMPL family transporter [Treponema sp.]